MKAFVLIAMVAMGITTTAKESSVQRKAANASTPSVALACGVATGVSEFIAEYRVYTNPTDLLYKDPSKNAGILGTMRFQINNPTATGLTIGSRYCVQGTYYVPSNDTNGGTVDTEKIFNQ